MTSHHWKDPVVEEAIAKFILGGGKMKRIFFVKNAKELSSAEVQAILTKQQTIGVQVYVVNSSSTPNDFKKNFMVESKGKVAWETHVDDDGHVSSTITTNRKTAENYRNIFEKLRINEADKFVSGTTADEAKQQAVV